MFVLISNCENSIIVFLYPVNLFEDLLIIPVSCNGFQRNSIIGLIKAEIKFNSKSMCIIIIFENSQDRII